MRLFEAEFIGFRLESEKERAERQLSLLRIRDIEEILPYSNNYCKLYYQVGEFTPYYLDGYFRKIPLIGDALLDSYSRWTGENGVKADTLGERISFAMAYIIKEKNSIDEIFAENWINRNYEDTSSDSED